MQFNVRLHHILFTAFTAIAAVPVVLLAFWVQAWALSQELEAVEEKHLLVARNLTHALSRYVAEVSSVFSNIALEVWEGEDSDAHDTLLTGVYLRHLWIVEPDGSVSHEHAVGGAPVLVPPQRLIAGLEAEQALAHSKPDEVIFSDLLLDDAIGEPVFILLKRLPGQGLAVAVLGTEYMRQLQQRIAFGDRGHAAIVDKTGRTMAHPVPAWQAEMKDMSFLPPVQAMKRGETGVSVFYTPAMQADMIAGYTAVPETGWGVMVPQPMEELEARAASVRGVAVAIALTGMGIAALLGWWLSGHLAGPIARVAEAALAVANGDLSTRVGERLRMVPREMRKLSESFNHMVGEIGAKTQALRITTRRLAEAQRIAHLGNWEWDIQRGRFWHSQEVATIFGHPPKSAMSRKRLLAQVHPDDQARLHAASQQVLTDHQPIQLQYRITLPDGGLRHIYQETALILGDDGKPRRLMGTLRDITEQTQQQEQLRWQATHDHLTALPNRQRFLQRLEDGIAAAHRSGEQLALISVDLDDVIAINNSLGYAAGDQLLCTAAERLCKVLPDDYLVARGSGDEFTVMLTGTDVVRSAAEAAERIIGELNRAFALEGHEIFIGGNIGIAIYPDDAADPKDMLRNARIASHVAKEAGKNCYRQFSREMDQCMQRRVTLRNELRHAVDRGEFEVYYQPIVDAVSGEIEAAEALVRWQHHNLGFVSPAEFIPLAEETGAIAPLGEWVLRTACEQAATWNRGRERPMRISVNLSTRQLRLGLTPARVAAILDEVGLPADQLSLEITESLILDDTDAMLSWLQDAHELGIHFSMDDFGTGYSSLSYLTRIPADTLKIDRSFINHIEQKPEELTLLGAIIALGRNMGLKLVAEGVETPAQLEYLRAHHCQLVQGYLFSKPLPTADFARLLQEGIPEAWSSRVGEPAAKALTG